MLSVRNALLAKMWRFCRPSEATTPPPISVGGPTEKIRPFQLKRKIRRGNFKKIIQGAVFLTGRMPALLAQALGLSLHGSAFKLEMGSSFGVNYHQLG